MSDVVRQSTARTITVGPVLDASGVAVTTSVVGDFKVSKNGGAYAALNASATLTHSHTGHYLLAYTASDVDTVGKAEFAIDATVNACPLTRLTVVEEAVYDALFAASAAGYQVPIWAAANSTVNLSGTTIKTATDVETDTADIQTRLPAALTAGGNIKADALAVGGSTTAAANMVTVYSTDFATNYNATDNYWYSQLADNVVHGGAGAVVQAFAWLGDWTNGVAVEPTSAREAVWNATTVAYGIAGTFGKAVSDVLADTGTDGVVVAAGSKTGYSLAASQTFDMTGNITGSLSGSVGSVTGAVGSVTGAVGSVTGNVGGIAGTITTLDALDTAQDTQHATTQAAVADLPTNAELATALAGADDAVLAAIAALNDPSAAEIATAVLTTAMTESYRAAGAAATLAQFAHEVMAHLGRSSIAGLTKTLDNLAGVPVRTFTLDADPPTAISEAT